MQWHPDQIHRFERGVAKAIRSAITNRSALKLRAVLDTCRDEPDHLAAVAATLRIDDRLILLHAEAPKAAKRDAFLAALVAWAGEAERCDFGAEVSEIIKQTSLIEAGYRLISDSIEALPISAKPPEVQLAALLHRSIRDYDHLLARGIAFAATPAEGVNASGRVVVKGDDGGDIDVDALHEAHAALLANCITFLGYERWPSGEAGIEVPPLPDPTNEDIEQAEHLLILSLSWTRWQRWERQARYWRGHIRRLEGKGLSEGHTKAGVTALFEFERSEGDLFDWFAVERLRHVTAQDQRELQRRGDLEFGPTLHLPPHGFLDLAERLSAAMIYGGAHLDHDDPTPRGGASIAEWLRGYSVLREIAGSAAEHGNSAVGRHLIDLSRVELVARLTERGLSAIGAEAFITGATFRAKSIDLFDCPLIRQGDDRLLLFGPAAANTLVGRALLSNLPNLGISLDHKGTLFEKEVVDFFRSRGAAIYTPAGTRDGEPYQIDAVLHWGPYLFLFE